MSRREHFDVLLELLREVMRTEVRPIIREEVRAEIAALAQCGAIKVVSQELVDADLDARFGVTPAGASSPTPLASGRLARLARRWNR